MPKSHRIGVDVSTWSYELRRKFGLRSCARMLDLQYFMRHLSETIETLAHAQRDQLLGPAAVLQVKDMLCRLANINSLLSAQVNSTEVTDPNELVARLEVAMSLIMPTYICLLYAGERHSLL